MDQQVLRKNTRLAKALNEDFSYKDFAEAIDINKNSFYNWLNGSYDLSKQKAKDLQGMIDNLL